MRMQKSIGPTMTDNSNFLRFLTEEMQSDEQVFIVKKDAKSEIVEQSGISAQCLQRYLENTRIYKNSHYYVTPASYQPGKERTESCLKALYAIVIDVDVEAKLNGRLPPMSMVAINRIVENFAEGKYDEVLPRPNVITKTGNGFHIWWGIHRLEATPDNVKRWEEALDLLLHKVDTVLNGINQAREDYVSTFVVNSMTSKLVNGIFRIPGTFNPKAMRNVTTKEVHIQRYKIEDFLPGPISQRSTKGTSAAKNIPEKNLVKWAGKMLQKVEQLRTARADRNGVELRNNFVYVYLLLLKLLPISDDEIWYRLLNFNSGFATPLTQSELTCSLKRAWERNYTIDTEKIISRLKITEQERIDFGFCIQHKATAHTERKKRNDNIIEQFEHGKTIKEIEKETGLHRNTVQTIVNKAGCTKRKDKIIYLNQCGLSAMEIAEEVKCSKRHVNRVLREYNSAEGVNGCGQRDILHSSPNNGVKDNGNIIMNSSPEGIEASRDADARKRPLYVEPLSPALSLLRMELKKRYGTNMTEGAFDRHFALLYERIKLCDEPTEDDVKAEFSGQLSKEQDEMYRYFLNIGQGEL